MRGDVHVGFCERFAGETPAHLLGCSCCRLRGLAITNNSLAMLYKTIEWLSSDSNNLAQKHFSITPHHPQYFTATILEWKHLLKPDKYKDVIIDSLKFLVKEKRVQVNTFVIMSNHIHLIWQVQKGFVRENVQRDFLKFTSQTIKRDLKKNHPAVLEKFLVNAKDRKYQIWERNPLSLDLLTKRYLFKR
jgi:REP element-mobilizing transposase RayT